MYGKILMLIIVLIALVEGCNRDEPTTTTTTTTTGTDGTTSASRSATVTDYGNNTNAL